MKQENNLIDLEYTKWTLTEPDRTLSDLEIYSSIGDRIATIPGSAGKDAALGGLDFRAPNLTMINLHIHDIKELGWWEQSYGTMTGCLVRNIGWDAPDRSHGHTLYTQNKAPNTKMINGNIFIKGFGGNIRVYGSNSSKLENYYFIENIVVGERWLIGGGVVKDVDVFGNFIYADFQMGYGSDPNISIYVYENRIIGDVQLNYTWKQVDFRENLIVGDVIYVHGTPYTNCRWDNNVYIGTVFTIDGGKFFRKSFEEWQKATGFDANSAWYPNVEAAVDAGALTLPLVQTYGVHQGKHHANLAIWNPLNQMMATVNLDRFYFGDTIMEWRQARNPKKDRRPFAFCGRWVPINLQGEAEPPLGDLSGLYHPEQLLPDIMPTFSCFELWEL